MPGKATAVNNGEELKRAVAALGKSLGLNAETEVKVGRRNLGREAAYRRCSHLPRNTTPTRPRM